jgi:hypothetical protein
MAKFELQPLSLDDARKMVRVGRMDPEMHHDLSDALDQMKENPEQAFVLKLPEDMKYLTARMWLLRLALQMELPLTIRKAEGGRAIVFWRASEAEVQQRPIPPRGRRKTT